MVAVRPAVGMELGKRLMTHSFLRVRLGRSYSAVNLFGAELMALEQWNAKTPDGDTAEYFYKSDTTLMLGHKKGGRLSPRHAQPGTMRPQSQTGRGAV